MRKILSLLCVAVLFLSFAAVSEGTDIVGTWYTQLYGQRLTFIVNEDHTYEKYLVGHEEEPDRGAWEWGEGLVLLDGSAATVLVPMNGAMILTDNPDVYMLTRTEPPAFSPAAANASATLDDYQGVWRAYRAAFAGLSFDTALEGIDLTLTFSDATALLHSDSLDMEDVAMDASLATGALQASETNESGEVLASHTFQLLTDGALCYGIQPDNVQYYFMKDGK